MKPSHVEDAAKELERLLSLSTPRQRHHYRQMAELSGELGDTRAPSTIRADDGEFAELLAEYESLRQESVTSINNRDQALILYATAIAVVVGGALIIDNPAERRLLLL